MSTSGEVEHVLEASLADWFSEKHMSQVVKRKLDGAFIVTLLAPEDEDDYSINLTTLAHDIVDDMGLALPATSTEAEWQPIATVPKGERVQLYNELWEDTYGEVQIGVRMDDAADVKWLFDSGMDISPDANWTDGDLTPEDYEPTHWMLLPAKPRPVKTAE